MRKLKGIAFLFLLISSVILGLEASSGQQPKSLVITGATLIDGTGAAPQKDMVIIIAKGKFVAIGTKGEVIFPKDAEVIDVKGKTVIPGLIDAHTHITSPPKKEDYFTVNDAISALRAVAFLNRYLMIGVTTVRDVASDWGCIAVKKAFQEGLFVGSRPIVAGQGITSTGGHGTAGPKGIMAEADGPDGFRKAVREQLKAGADLIKILSPYSREEIRAAIEETHAHEKFVAVHSGIFKNQLDPIRWAVEDGADSIEHAYAIPDDVISLMAEKKIYCVPTIYVLLLAAEAYKKERGPEWEWKIKKYLEGEEIFRKMKKAGIKMGIGTDTVDEYNFAYPWSYFDEIEVFVKNGCTPMEAILAATKINAEICDVAEKLGTIEKGKLADVLVINGDPLSDIKALRNAQIIIQEGKIIKR